MNTLSRTVTGIFTIILGIILIVVGFFEWVALIYGVPLLVIGLFILFNDKEDEIENIKNQRFLGSSKSKKNFKGIKQRGGKNE